MTAQIAEKLYYNGDEHSMTTNPLSDYFYYAGIKPDFADTCTALWRGYVGTWEILDNRLYLIGLHGTLNDGNQATLATFFPDFPERVFAHWYTGTIRLPQGKLIKYVHMGYASTYERDIMLSVEKGVIVETTVRHNGIADDNAPNGYGVGGFTIFHLQKTGERSMRYLYWYLGIGVAVVYLFMIINHFTNDPSQSSSLIPEPYKPAWQKIIENTLLPLLLSPLWPLLVVFRIKEFFSTKKEPVNDRRKGICS